MRLGIFVCLLTVFAVAERAAALDAPSIALSAEMSASQATAAERIRADVAWLADDARQGREAGTQGYRDAAAYVAARFGGLGLKPAGENGAWFQNVPLRSARPFRRQG